MPTPHLTARRLQAQLEDADAKLEMLEAKAKTSGRSELDAIAGLRMQRDYARQRLAEFRAASGAEMRTAEMSAETALGELAASIGRTNARLLAWDEAVKRRFDARVDQANAQLGIWQARARESLMDGTPGVREPAPESDDER